MVGLLPGAAAENTIKLQTDNPTDQATNQQTDIRVHKGS